MYPFGGGANVVDFVAETFSDETRDRRAGARLGCRHPHISIGPVNIGPVCRPRMTRSPSSESPVQRGPSAVDVAERGKVDGVVVRARFQFGVVEARFCGPEAVSHVSENRV